MIDAGYNYDRLEEKMGWLGIDPRSIRHILITHQDTDHVGAVEADSPGLFRKARLYVGEIENRYLTGEVRRRVIYHLYKLPQVNIPNEKALLTRRTGRSRSAESRSSAFSCPATPGATWSISSTKRYLFTGDTIWFGADGGYSFISALAEDNRLAVRSLAALEQKLPQRAAFARCSSPATPAGRTISNSPSPTRIGSARPSASACPTRPRPTTPTTNRTTRRKTQSADF